MHGRLGFRQQAKYRQHLLAQRFWPGGRLQLAPQHPPMTVMGLGFQQLHI